MPVDGVHPHADTVHQPPGRGSDAAKAEDSADPAREHAVLRELIKLAKFEVFVLQDQALGGSKCHRQRVLSYRLGVAAAVGCHWNPLRKLAQRNEVHATDHELDQPRVLQQLCLAGPQLLGGIECQDDAGVAQRFGAGHLIELGEIYNIACAGESVGNDRLTLLAQFEGDDERWSAQLHAPPRLARLGSRSRAEYVLIGALRSENRSGQMGAAKQLKAAILARSASKGRRGKRTRPGPRQYTVADLERARDRVAAAERRIDNDHKSNRNRGRAGLERAQLELHIIESQLRLHGLLE